MQRSTGLALLIGALVGAGIGYAAARQGHLLPVSAGSAGERVSEVLAGREPLRRLVELGGLLERLGPDAATPVAEAVARSTLDRSDPELVLIATWWAAFDPQAAYRWTTQEWRATDAGVIGAVFRTWAHREPEMAFGVAQTITFRGHRELATDSAVAGWDGSGQPGLLEFLAKLPEVARQNAAEIVARRRVVALGAAGALEWASTLESPAYRALFVPRVASAAALADPKAAAAWAEPQIAAATRPTGLPRRIATRWVQSDPQGALDWLSTLPEGRDRDDGVTEAFRDWLGRDAIGAQTWIQTTEMQRWNEPAFGLFARSQVASSDPKGALEIVSRFSDEPLRNYLTTVIARSWLERDWKAADAWIKQAELPDGVRERAYMVSRPQKSRIPEEPPAEPPADAAAPETGT